MPFSCRLLRPTLLAFCLTLLLAMSAPSSVYGQIDCSMLQLTDEVGANFGAASLSSGSPWITFSGNGVDALGSGFEVYRVNFLTGVRENLTETLGYDGNSTVNGDGTRIAFESQNDLTGGNPDGNREIFWLDLTTRQLTQVTDTTRRGNFRPKISDAGTRILFNSTNDLVGQNPAGANQAFLYEMDRASLSQLTQNTSISLSQDVNSAVTLLAFSSDGDLTGENPEGNHEIFLLKIDSGEMIQVTQTSSGDNVTPTISDDGQRLTFRSDSVDLIGSHPAGRVEALFHDRRKGTFLRLSEINPNTTLVSLTPDGHRILMGFGTHLSLYDLATGALEVLVNEPGITTFESTRPDGSLLSIRSNRDLTGGNPDHSFEIFLAICDPPPSAPMASRAGWLRPGRSR